MTEHENTYHASLEFIKEAAFQLQKSFPYEKKKVPSKVPFLISLTPKGVKLTDISEDEDTLQSGEKEASLRAAAAILNLRELTKQMEKKNDKNISEDLITLALYGSAQLIQAMKLLMNAHGKSQNTAIDNFLKTETMQSAFKVLEGGEKARDIRYGNKRALYEQATIIARDKWKGGCNMRHNLMKDWLLDEYEDDNGKMPFTVLSSSGLNKKLKELLYDIGKPELIHGLPSDPTP